MADGELADTFGKDPQARLASYLAEDEEDRPEPLDDLDREAIPGDPPVPGAQWDELHRRWEHWDEKAHAWVIVGDDVGDGIDPADEAPLTPLLARELLHADDLEAHHPHEADVAHAGEPQEGPAGAQWNEVTDRWERWDEAAQAWVAAEPDPEA